ncbi:MAG TPA: ABC transporter ATP-binding protein, partial [Acidimicrobiaceae bacterium]|nr:ABC transporter ATP-binding protein [Acidimicrobiaceae bacterium]
MDGAGRTVTEPPGDALLDVRGVSVRFGGIQALDHVSMAVAGGESVGLVGPNGA